MTADPMLLEIAELSAQLGDIDNRLRDKFGEIENALRRWISTRIEVPSKDEPFSRVAFGKHDGVWGILLERSRDQWEHVNKCPRDWRALLLVNGYLVRLLDAAAEQIRVQLEQRRTATNAADQLIAILTVSQPGDIA